MILQRLLLENFKQYSNLDLAFREGLIGVIGKNGAGKSSIFDGILLCLFGSAGSTDKAFYKTRWAEKKDKVKLELWLEVGGKEFRILREFRGKALAPYAGIYDHNDQQIATGATAVNEEVTKLIGMDKDAFTRSIFSGQKELGILSNTRGEERKKMVRKMIGLDNLDQIQKLIREDRNNLRKTVEGQKALLLSPEDLKIIQKECKDFDKELKVLQKSLDGNQKILVKKNKAYQDAKKAFTVQNEAFKKFTDHKHEETKFLTLLQGIKSDQERIQTELTNLKVLEKDQKKLEKPVADHLKDLEVIAKQKKEKIRFHELKDLETQQANYRATLTEIKSTIKELTKSTANHPKLTKILSQLDSKIIEQQKARDQQSKELQQLTEAKGKILGRIADRKKQRSTIVELGQDAQCPTCLQPLINAYEKTVKKLDSEIDQYEKTELKTFEKQLKTLSISKQKQEESLEKLIKEKQVNSLAINEIEGDIKRIKVAKERLEKGEKVLVDQAKKIKGYDDLNFDPKKYDALKSKIEAFSPAYLEYKINADKLKNRTSLTERFDKNQSRIANGQVKIKELGVLIKSIGYSSEKHQAAQEKQDATESEKDQIQHSVQELIRQQELIERNIATRQQSLKTDEANRNTIAKNQASFDELEKLDGLFKAFKTFILDKIKPTITNHAGELFERITKGRYESIHVDDNFDFQIYEGGIPYPISSFSGGEIDLANLCLRIGISKAIAELSGSTEALSFLGFDEIFGSQDEDRRMEILLALEHLKEQYRQIYIITHIAAVKDYFPNILQVTESGKGSRAVFQ